MEQVPLWRGVWDTRTVLLMVSMCSENHASENKKSSIKKNGYGKILIFVSTMNTFLCLALICDITKKIHPHTSILPNIAENQILNQ